MPANSRWDLIKGLIVLKNHYCYLSKRQQKYHGDYIIRGLRDFFRQTSKTSTNNWCPIEQAEMSDTSTEVMTWRNRRADA